MGNSKSSTYHDPHGGPSSHSTDTSGAKSEPSCSKHHAHFIRRVNKLKHVSWTTGHYNSIPEVQAALGATGLKTCNLIVGIDFTKSNEWTGRSSFSGRNLHDVNDQIPNPYEQAVSIVGRTLSVFDGDGLIPCFGFGDVTTYDKHVFSFHADGQPCQGFDDLLWRYRQIVPHVRMAGPTSFAPIIQAAMQVVQESGGEYHILVIIADGQVTRGENVPPGQYSDQEKSTIEAVIAASGYPLSIVVVGVGDGPWDIMYEADNHIPERIFDNFQFVDFTAVIRKDEPAERKEARLAHEALLEIPDQFQAIIELGLLGDGPTVTYPPVLPPPPRVLAADKARLDAESAAPSAAPSAPPLPPELVYAPSAPPPLVAEIALAYPPPPPQVPDSQVCPVCFVVVKNIAFNCGHQTCEGCASTLTDCPVCHKHIELKVKLQ